MLKDAVLLYNLDFINIIIQLNQPDTSTRSDSKDTNEGCEI